MCSWFPSKKMGCASFALCVLPHYLKTEMKIQNTYRAYTCTDRRLCEEQNQEIAHTGSLVEQLHNQDFRTKIWSKLVFVWAHLYAMWKSSVSTWEVLLSTSRVKLESTNRWTVQAETKRSRSIDTQSFIAGL